MNLKLFLSSAFFLATVAGTLQAANLKDCVGLAAANSAAVKAYEEKLNASMAANERDRKALLPQLSAAGEEGYSTYARQAGLEDGLTGKVGLQLNWDLAKVLAKYPRLSRLEADKARVLLTLAQKALARDVAKDYYQLHVLVGKKTDYAAAQDYFSSHIKDIERLRDQGLDVKLDLLRASIQLKSLAVSAATIETDIAGALLSLNSATGGKFETADLAFSDIPVPAGMETPAAGEAAPLEARLDELETETAAENYRQSAYAYAPSLTFGVDRSVTPIDPATELYRTFLALNIGIFDFGQKAADRKSLLAASEFQRQTALDNRRKLLLAAARLEGEIRNAAFACRITALNLADADKSLETARDYYRQGKIKETDLLTTASDYLGVKEQARDALAQYLDKLADLYYLKN